MVSDPHCGPEPSYLELVHHYEACLARHGDTHLGVDWPNQADAATRYRIMLDIVRQRHAPERPTLLDVGCGAGHLLEHARRHGPDIRYTGVDLSARFIDLCRVKFPGETFLQLDLLRATPAGLGADFVVANGLFTEKRSLSWDAMWEFTRGMIRVLFGLAGTGLAFNVMSSHVDWQRDDLFHLPCDVLAAFLRAEVSRHSVLRADYGLHEYTAYVFREAA